MKLSVTIIAPDWEQPGDRRTEHGRQQEMAQALQLFANRLANSGGTEASISRDEFSGSLKISY